MEEKQYHGIKNNMIYTSLGETDIKVSKLCLGTMTWGSQNTQNEVNDFIDISLSNGLNFFDTAEMYPTTPKSSETQGLSEKYLGQWIKSSKKRDSIVVASKVVGEGYMIIRNGEPISPKSIRKALEGSLRNLNTDFIDLYQLHWPNRGSYHFRRNWEYNPFNQNKSGEKEEMFLILNELNKLVSEGKIRSIGLSNETAWGTMQFIEIAKKEGFSKIVSIQNEYSLLCRWFDLDLSELCHYENIGLLAYSPLAAGILAGKYKNNIIPEKSRRSIDKTLFGRAKNGIPKVVENYQKLASKNNLDIAQMSLSFCLSRPFMTSVIFGATNKKQLLNNLNSININISSEIIAELNNIFKQGQIPF